MKAVALEGHLGGEEEASTGSVVGEGLEACVVTYLATVEERG